MPRGLRVRFANKFRLQANAGGFALEGKPSFGNQGTVNVAAYIITQPSPPTVVEGQDATVSVFAGGTAPISYQWYRSGSPIGGATSAGYTLTNAQLTDAGATFYCRVSNAYGSENSNTVALTVTPYFPTWAQGASGTITVINSGTTLYSSTMAAGASDPAYNWQSDSMQAYSGGALVNVSGVPYLVCKGGGHTNGKWNGAIKFGPLAGVGSDAPRWSAWCPASAPGAVRDTLATYTDGRQAAVHTYGDLVGVGNTLYSMQTDGTVGGSSITYNDAFKVVDGSPPVESPIANNITTGKYGAAAHYNGKIYYIAGITDSTLRVYDIASNTWSTVAGSVSYNDNYPALAVDTTRGKLLMVATNCWYWDLLAGTAPREVLGVTDPTGDNCVEYCPTRDAFVIPVNGAAQVKELSASSLASGGNPSWTTRTFSGTAPTGLDHYGTFGRWRHVPALAGYILVPNSNSHVWFFKA